VLGLAAAAIGSALALLLGIVSAWRDLYLPNRMVVVVSVIAACLIRLYSVTRSRLEERNRQLEEKVEAETRTLLLHEQDFERAREIQEALMPRHLPQIRGCRLAASCQPARSVGGDYYDAIRVGNSSVAIAVGDVSGKGMAAALLMSNLQAIVRAFAPAGLAPDELCAKANGLIAGDVASGKYITFFYGVADTARMRLDYCSAATTPYSGQARRHAGDSLRRRAGARCISNGALRGRRRRIAPRRLPRALYRWHHRSHGRPLRRIWRAASDGPPGAPVRRR
jgi:hypothetical protein